MKYWLSCVVVLLVLKLHLNVAVEEDFEESLNDYSGNDIDTNTIENKLGGKQEKPGVNEIGGKPEKPEKPVKPVKPGNPEMPGSKETSTSIGPLGQGFEIHKMDLLTKQLQSTGATIFEDLDMKKCATTDKLGATTKDSSFYSNTHSLYTSLSTNSKLDVDLKGTYTLGVSISAVTNNIAMSNEEVSGLSLNLVARAASHAFSKDCINNSPLTSEFKSDFEGLKNKINEPWKKESWREYSAFLTKYGSHIVQDVISGSSIYQYVFAESSKKFSQRDFTVKACVSLAGPTQVGEIGVSACSEVSKEEIEASSKISMTQKLVFRGGTAETRAKLSNNITPELIEAFLQEGVTDPSPILYTFYPIWDILEIRYGNTEHAAKVYNLLQFYRGFLSFECDYQVSHNKKVEMQRFELSPDSGTDTPIYQCTLGPQSCHDNDDCHYEHAFWCSCAGESCIRYRDQQLKSGSTKKIAYIETARREWGWHGCKRHVFSCRCDEPGRTRDVSWSGRLALEDMHVLLPKKSRVQVARNTAFRYHPRHHPRHRYN